MGWLRQEHNSGQGLTKISLHAGASKSGRSHEENSQTLPELSAHKEVSLDGFRSIFPKRYAQPCKIRIRGYQSATCNHTRFAYGHIPRALRASI